jgi:FkbM family methyltransferase
MPVMHDPQLIFDIGAHDGTDTAFYLRQGYRVVGVEANPALTEKLSRRFARERAEGRLTVVQAVVAECDGVILPFYVSRNDHRSSLDPGIAAGDGLAVTPVFINSRTLSSMFREFGIPVYCKLDIEGADASAIRGLEAGARPPLISCEACSDPIATVGMKPEKLHAALDALQMAGYRQFKLVDQEHGLVLDEASHYGRLHSLSGRLRAKWENFTGWYTRKHNLRRFLIRRGVLPGEETSGLWGDDLPGDWADYDRTKKRLHYHFQDYFIHTQNRQLIFWVDIHAR